jgi:hypothetical protein
LCPSDQALRAVGDLIVRRLREPVRADPQARPVVSDPSTNFLTRYNDLSVQRRMVCSLITSDGGRVDR